MSTYLDGGCELGTKITTPARQCEWRHSDKPTCRSRGKEDNPFLRFTLLFHRLLYCTLLFSASKPISKKADLWCASVGLGAAEPFPPSAKGFPRVFLCCLSHTLAEVNDRPSRGGGSEAEMFHGHFQANKGGGEEVRLKTNRNLLLLLLLSLLILGQHGIKGENTGSEMFFFFSWLKWGWERNGAEMR